MREKAKCVEPDCDNLDGGDENYPGLCGLHAWRAWFKLGGNGAYWDKVQCIECELGRRCELHPEAQP